MNIFSRLIYLVKKINAIRNSRNFIKFLQKNHVQVGENVIFREPRSTRIDLTRPSLISIGNDVDINTHFCIMTHDFANFVFRNMGWGYINSSGAVTIGNNIYFGTNVTILKGVEIGDNCIIGAGSLITKNIPSNSVAAGVPCKVICSLEDYYEKRKAAGLQEAVEYIKAFRKRMGRNPKPNLEMREEWMYFIDSTNMNNYPDIPIKQRVGKAYNNWVRNYKAPFHSYEDFIESIQ